MNPHSNSIIPLSQPFKMAPIGRYVVEDRYYGGSEYTCTICRSQFYDFIDAEEHCREDHSWCERCDQVFVSEASKRDHLLKSQRIICALSANSTKRNSSLRATWKTTCKKSTTSANHAKDTLSRATTWTGMI
jgi:hypothetical protein